MSPQLIADNAFGTYGLVLPFVAWLTLIAPWRLGRRAKEGGFRSQHAPPLYTDVGRTVGRHRRRRAAKRVGTAVYILSALGTANLLATQPENWRGTAVRLLLLTLLARGLHAWSRESLPPRRPAKRAPIPRRAIGLLLQAVSNLMAVTALTVYLALISMSVLLAQEPRLYDQALEVRLPDGLTTWERVVLSPLKLATQGGLGEARAALAAFSLIAIGSYVLNRFGRHLVAPTARDVEERDERPYFLYLRSFDEDAAKIYTTFGRRGLINRIAPRSTRRFEEVLVDELSRFAPVVTVSPPGARLASLGAAKFSLDNTDWKEAIEAKAGGALAVVMSATPAEIRDGFDHEIGLIGRDNGNQRVLLVLSPWTASETQRRFGAFQRHTADIPLFRPLATFAQPGTQVLAHTPAEGWRAWGARRHWDYTYAYSLIQAVQWALPAWHESGCFEGRAFEEGPRPAR